MIPCLKRSLVSRRILLEADREDRVTRRTVSRSPLASGESLVGSVP
jgi:hypothetical protein